MWRKTIVWISALSVVLFISIVAMETVSAGGEHSTGQSEAVKLISGFQKWKKANDQPILMSQVIAQLCITPQPSLIKSHTGDPHSKKYLMVYVNPVGEKEFFNKSHPRFPEGSVIVKQKLSGTNLPPELLTVMVKRQPDFNPENGDWEYMTFDGTGSKLLSRGKIKSCQECHEMQSTEDYVFRDYGSFKFQGQQASVR